MIKKVIFIFSLFILGLTGNHKLSAQARLRVDSIINLPAKLKIDSVYTTLKYVLRNTGNQTFNGKPTVLYQTDIMSNTQYMYYHWTLPNITILPGDTFTVSSPYFKAEKANFKVGNNIVVIWPSAITSPPAHETITIEITAIPASVGIEEYQNDTEISIYPVPVTNKLNILSLMPENDLERVRILNVFGQEIFSSQTEFTSINTSDFSAGIYYLHVQFKNRPPGVYRFVKH